MTIFAIASTTMLVRSAQARRTVALALAGEDRLNKASAFLDHVVLWPREDFDRHLGAHPQGQWLLEIEHPEATLYTVTVLDGESHEKLVNTVVYRTARRTPAAY